MHRLKKLLTEPFPENLRVLPGGPVLIPMFYTLTGLALNYILIRSILTGEMLGARASGWVEGRESAPMLYWIYVVGLALFVVPMNAMALVICWQYRRRP